MSDIEAQGKKLTSILAANRTENIGMDVWDAFVVPRYYDLHDFFSTMPCRIEGGRGCGKTMLLRYLSYESQYSEKREFNDEIDLSNIGLYWRANTQFLRQLTKRGIDEEKWSQCFAHYFALKISLEIFKSTSYLHENKNTIEGYENIIIEGLEVYNKDLKGNILEITKKLENLRKEFEIAVANPSLLEDYIFLPITFIDSAADEIKTITKELEKTNYHIFIDEYENLLPYQQKIINTCLKHSEPPIIYKIACKKNGMPNIETTGDEAIANKHDYIIHDLDNYIKDEYTIFASEVLLSRLDKAKGTTVKISLSSVSSLERRREDQYKKDVTARAKAILPGRKHSELSDDIFSKPVLKGKLSDMIKQALKSKNETTLTEKDFIKEEAKEASIVCTALLNRESNKTTEILMELKNHIENEKSKFSDWIGTNFVGCYLNIIKRKRDENRLYCGFETYIALSQGNLRHFLELCRTAFSAGFKNQGDDYSITTENQSFAAIETSSALFSEIKSFKPHGHKIQQFANRLGELFSLHQSRLSQSEPEKNHFSIKGGMTSLKQETKSLLDECEKWGVLSKQTATKTKDRHVVDDDDWVLNPIYAPKFEISYRKKRKLTLTAKDIEALFSDDSSEYESIYDKHKSKSRVSDEKNNESLFLTGDMFNV